MTVMAVQPKIAEILLKNAQEARLEKAKSSLQKLFPALADKQKLQDKKNG